MWCSKAHIIKCLAFLSVVLCVFTIGYLCGREDHRTIEGVNGSIRTFTRANDSIVEIGGQLKTIKGRVEHSIEIVDDLSDRNRSIIERSYLIEGGLLKLIQNGERFKEK